MQIAKGVYLVGSGDIGLSNGDCHVYLLDGGDELALIDAGVGARPETILENIRADGHDPGRIAWLLLTHAHADHAGGCLALKAVTSAQIVATAEEGRLLAEGTDEELGLDAARRSGIYPDDYVYAHVDPDQTVSHGDVLYVGESAVRVIVVGGHSWACACYLVEAGETRVLFSSDVVFHGGTIGLGNWSGSSLEAYRRDIGRLTGLGVEALFPGHYLWTVRGGQAYLDTAVSNLREAWVPPAWLHMHPHR